MVAIQELPRPAGWYTPEQMRPLFIHAQEFIPRAMSANERAFFLGVAIENRAITKTRWGDVEDYINFDLSSLDETRRDLLINTIGTRGGVSKDKARIELDVPGYNFVLEPTLALKREIFANKEQFSALLAGALIAHVDEEGRFSLEDEVLQKTQRAFQGHFGFDLGSIVYEEGKTSYIALSNPEEVDRVLKQSRGILSLPFARVLNPKADDNSQFQGLNGFHFYTPEDNREDDQEFEDLNKKQPSGENSTPPTDGQNEQRAEEKLKKVEILHDNDIDYLVGLALGGYHVEESGEHIKMHITAKDQATRERFKEAVGSYADVHSTVNIVEAQFDREKFDFLLNAKEHAMKMRIVRSHVGPLITGLLLTQRSFSNIVLYDNALATRLINVFDSTFAPLTLGRVDPRKRKEFTSYIIVLRNPGQVIYELTRTPSVKGLPEPIRNVLFLQTAA